MPPPLLPPALPQKFPLQSAVPIPALAWQDMQQLTPHPSPASQGQSLQWDEFVVLTL